MDRKCQLIMKKKFTQILLASVIVSSTLVPFVQAEAAGTSQTSVSHAG
ncbi:N-acetylmuramoyl-L-alanine amidase, partial [Listeria monocytogenes]|nr:N-acetylmuramoyl-L-alanine amidase [Listeria monocytogenes]